MPYVMLKYVCLLILLRLNEFRSMDGVLRIAVILQHFWCAYNMEYNIRTHIFYKIIYLLRYYCKKGITDGDVFTVLGV